MKYIRFIIAIFILAQLGFAQVVSTHPRVMLDTDIIQKLKDRRAQNTAEWQRLKQRLDAYYSWTGEEIISDYIGQYEYIMTYALGYYASDLQAYMDKAVDILMAFYNATNEATIQFDSGYRSRSYLFSMALGYDWCYNSMTDTQRQQIRNRIIVWADWVKANGYAVWGSQYFEPGNNYSSGHLAGITATAYAIHSENAAKGNEFITHSTNTIADILPFINSRLSGGDANEGWSYGSGYAMSLFYAFAAIKSATTDHHDYFLETTWDEQIIEFLIYATLPDRDHILPNGDWARESTGLIWDQHRTVSDQISSYSNIQSARQLACFWGKETYPTSDFHNFYVWRPFLFYNHQETAVDYKTAAPFNNRHWIFTDSSGTGQFVQRTDWGQDAIWVSFRAGGMYGDHAHNGNGHVEIWENGWLVIDQNILSSSGILIPDHAHNRVQIEPMSETWNLPDNPYNRAEHAEIPRREFTSSYSYIWENSTNVYQRQKNNTATKTERQFFFLPQPKIVITFDIAATNSASNYKKNRWHFYGSAGRSGNVISYSNGTSKVFCHPLYPLNPSISLDNNVLDIEYTNAAVKNYFITVLYTTAANASALSVQGISRDHGNVQESDVYGAAIARGNTSYSVVFKSDDPGFNYNHIAYNMEIYDFSYHYLAGLDKETTYYVTLSSNANTLNVDINRQQTVNSMPITSSENGVLHFTYSMEPGPQPPQNLRFK